MSVADELANVEMAIDMIWNCKLEMAEQLLSTGTDALSLHYYSEVAFMRAILTENKNDAKTCYARVDAARKQAEKVLIILSSTNKQTTNKQLTTFFFCFVFVQDLKTYGKKVPKDGTVEDQKAACYKILRARIAQAESTLWDASVKMRMQSYVKGSFFSFFFFFFIIPSLFLSGKSSKYSTHRRCSLLSVWTAGWDEKVCFTFASAGSTMNASPRCASRSRPRLVPTLNPSPTIASSSAAAIADTASSSSSSPSSPSKILFRLPQKKKTRERRAL